MRRLSFIMAIVLCLVFADQAHAQRQLPGMQGIQVTGGMVDGIYSSALDNEAGYYFGVAMATYAKKGISGCSVRSLWNGITRTGRSAFRFRSLPLKATTI